MSVSISLNSAVFSALFHWVTVNRQLSPLLDDVADGILLRLRQVRQQYLQVECAMAAPPVVGLYGHSARGKAHLRSLMVVPSAEAAFLTALADTGKSPQMAVRFGPVRWPERQGFPLCLTLFSEGELAQIFLRHHFAGGDAHPFDPVEMRHRLDEARRGYDSGEVTAMDAEQVVSLADTYRRLTGVSELGIWCQMAESLPLMSLAQRARCLALLWGDNHSLTRRWQATVMALQQLGNVRYVLAPESLLLDRYRQPVMEFLNPEDAGSETASTSVSVCPLVGGEPGGPIAVPCGLLSLLCAELRIGATSGEGLPEMDVLDIPGYQRDTGRKLGLSKRNFLSDFYRQNGEPELLLICQSVEERKDNREVASLLIDWLPAVAETPRLAWAVTPFDARFDAVSGMESVDGAVQSLLNSAHYPWGVCQAITENDARRLICWMSDNLSNARRGEEILRRQRSLEAEVSELFQRWLVDPVTQGPTSNADLEALVKALQQQAAGHGALLNALLPARSALQRLWQQNPPSRESRVDLFDFSLDLFAGERHEVAAPEAASADFEHAAHRLWVNHLRLWAEKGSDGLNLSTRQRRTLCEILITTSYRLDLPGGFTRILSGCDRSVLADSARVMSALSDFISWLGYAGQDASVRPASRWNPGHPVFSLGVRPRSSERLTKLEANPVHAATHYVYDWLVALWTRATENINYRHPQDVSPDACLMLRTLLQAQ
ncbi:hypothetical protein GIX45_02015 [Erwinia sp. CPCC 100877]|nr:hypothetical protein [Erwinia sp. CPCC 100877]